ncbi:hypothetical protein GCM10022223_58960 [Kineosporia mesophila]|uniref:Excreted virulence factor EspC (Type VII ESX diderm) n=1 Tax=Kineosporia mesophila TaxID=566012 RepID=A0ABP7AII3_9ACTN|nr:hypothetical protein [Kineosporia mesophila]MCD5350744.1 hypothetical protein [Kineosporia mesophila]
MNARTNKTPDQYADDAAEAVRSLNHATLRTAGGYVWPADVDAVIAHLTTAVAGSEQALRQGYGWLARAAKTGAVGHDAGADVAGEMAVLRTATGEAIEQVQVLTARLNEMRLVTAHLTGVIADGEGK